MSYMIMDIIIVFYPSLENLAYRFGFIQPQATILTDSQNYLQQYCDYWNTIIITIMIPLPCTTFLIFISSYCTTHYCLSLILFCESSTRL